MWTKAPEGRHREKLRIDNTMKESSMAETTIWGIHAGQYGEAEPVFLKHNCVALGWELVGNLGAVPPSREEFKKLIASHYPQTKVGAIPVHGGLLYKFVHEMKPHDIVAYPSKATRTIHLGRVTGPYTWVP